jgi:hypothetical protein
MLYVPQKEYHMTKHEEFVKRIEAELKGLREISAKTLGHEADRNPAVRAKASLLASICKATP